MGGMMPFSLILFGILLVATGIERLVELVISRRHAAWAFAQGGVESGRGHFPAMVLLHTGLLAAAFLEAWLGPRPFVPALGWTMLGIALLCQAGRYWVIWALGRQWNTRVIVVPGLSLSRRGPYRWAWLRHPQLPDRRRRGRRPAARARGVDHGPRLHGAQRDPAPGLPHPRRGARARGLPPGAVTSHDTEIVVVGGGPIGLASAIEARLAGFDVVVVEPRHGVVDKACGEGLMPGSIPALARLGVAPEGLPLRGVVYRDDRRAATHRFAEGHALGVRRTTLHAALLDRAEEVGVRRVEARVSDVELRAGSVAAVTAAARVRGSWMLACDGLHSTVARAVRLRRETPRARRRFGQRRHYAVAPWSDLIEVHWTRHAELYVTPVAVDTVGVAVLARPGVRFGDALAESPELAARLAGAVPVSSVRGAGPLRQSTVARHRGRVLLVGDASGYVDALTGEGVRMGLAQAQAAVAAIRAADPGTYERAWTEATRDLRRMTSALVAVAMSPLRSGLVPVASAAPGLFGAAVERLAR